MALGHLLSDIAVHSLSSTNNQGSAEKIVNVQLDPNTTGQATLRLRQNTTAKYNEAVTIGKK